MNRPALNRRLHAAGRDAGLVHEQLRELAPRVLGEEPWFRAGRSLANLTDADLQALVWSVEGWKIVEEARGRTEGST